MSGPSTTKRVDLLKLVPGLKWLLTRRWFQFAVVLPNLAFFYFFVIAGLFGSPVGNRNIIIIFVWILWWFLLIAIMVPFASRIWCTMCPIPFFGEWYQRRALIGARVGKPGVGRNRMWGLNKRWPKKLANIWLQNIGFLLLCTFSVALLTRPIVSALVLGGLIVLATVLHVIYRHRAFCSYVCPISGFLSLYSMSSMIEVRAEDGETCANCKDKACLAGGETGWGCPWHVYPSKLDRNNYCGLCMECLKTCAHDNMTIRARPFFSDTLLKGYDEAWKAFIMVSLALAYSVTLLGPWGTVKDWANPSESGMWGGFLAYAFMLWGFALLLVPGVFYGAARLGRRLAGASGAPMKEIFLGFSGVLVPLGLTAWIAFSMPLIFVNGSYILNAISDPMGRGWDLFGTASFPWTPFYPEYVAYIQIALLFVGLYYALRTAYRFARDHFGAGPTAVRACLPVAMLSTAICCGFLWLFVG
jgi:hypothetical protein